MNDDILEHLLNQTDAQFHRAKPVQAVGGAGTFVDAVRRRRARQTHRRVALGALAVLAATSGLTAWTLRGNVSNHGHQISASNAATNTAGPSRESSTETGSHAHVQPLSEQEIARLMAEIAALDAEANRARRLVDLYRSAEARRERLAALEVASAEPLFPPAALAELAIDRAAAVTLTSADAQANQFNRPNEAAESYRSVLSHFPSSRWAAVAQQRLEAMKLMN